MSNSMKKIVSLLLIALVVISIGCEKEAKGEPYYVLTVGARVVDAEGNPIQGIYAYPEGASFCGREGYSDYKGEIGAWAYLKPGEAGIIIFEDIDGDYNGGVYNTVRVDISDRLSPSITPDEWGYAGASYIELGDVIMSKQ